jgi:hypothetical protein
MPDLRIPNLAASRRPDPSQPKKKAAFTAAELREKELVKV